MKLTRLTVAALALAASGASMAGTILSEGFDDISTLGVKGWSQQNLSLPLGPSSWFQGNTTVFSASSGAADSYIAANFLNSAANAGGSISNWLMTPVVDINKSITLNFDLRLESGSGFNDTVQVYYSTSGLSTDVTDFLLLDTYTSTSDTGWVSYSLGLAGFSGNATGRFAFRYVAANTDTQADYIGIDSVSVVPEPTSLALVGLALAGAAAARRRKAG